jgi:hypothetical protein
MSDAAPIIVEDMNCKNEKSEPMKPPNRTAFTFFVLLFKELEEELIEMDVDSDGIDNSLLNLLTEYCKALYA